MRSRKKVWISVLIFTILCWAGMSCKPRSEGAGSDESTTRDSEVGAEMNTTDLSREQILDAANKVARKHGLNPDRMTIRYDEGNEYWQASTSKLNMPELADKDYQAVSYWMKPLAPEGGFWVLVDKKTGRILKTVRLA